MAVIIKSPIDTRDHLYQATGKIINLPESIDLRVFDRDGIQNQSYTNSCVAHSSISLIEILLSRADRFVDQSRLFQYYNVRSESGLQGRDGGAHARMALKSLSDYGSLPETSYPFDLSKVNDQPPASCYSEAKALSGGEYCAIAGGAGTPERTQNVQCALAEGFPIFFAADIGDIWQQVNGSTLEETADFIAANCLKRPAQMSSHAMLFVGYRMYKGSLHLIVENSWGSGWGCGGYAMVPFDWWSCYSGDYWIMHSIPGITLPTIWTPQLEGQKPAPIKPVRPVKPAPPKHTIKCRIRMKFGCKCSCGAVK